MSVPRGKSALTHTVKLNCGLGIKRDRKSLGQHLILMVPTNINSVSTSQSLGTVPMVSSALLLTMRRNCNPGSRFRAQGHRLVEEEEVVVEEEEEEEEEVVCLNPGALSAPTVAAAAVAIPVEAPTNATCVNSSATAKSNWKTTSTAHDTGSTTRQVAVGEQGITVTVGSKLEPLLADSMHVLALASRDPDPPSPSTLQALDCVFTCRMEDVVCMVITAHLHTLKQNWMSGTSKDTRTKHTQQQQKVSLVHGHQVSLP